MREFLVFLGQMAESPFLSNSDERYAKAHEAYGPEISGLPDCGRPRPTTILNGDRDKIE